MLLLFFYDFIHVFSLNRSLTSSDNLKFQFSTDGEGNYGYLGADDSFIPFKKNATKILIGTGNTSVAKTFDVSTRDDYASLSKGNFLLVFNSLGVKTDQRSSAALSTSYNASTGKFTVSACYKHFNTYETDWIWQAVYINYSLYLVI